MKASGLDRGWRLAILLGVVASLTSQLGAGVAEGATAGWFVASEASPSIVRPGSNSLLLLHVANIGGAATDGSRVVVTDTLPVGMEAVEAGDIYDPQGEINTVAAEIKTTNAKHEEEVVSPRWLCSGRTVVTCENNPATQRVIAPTDGYAYAEALEMPTEAPEIGIRMRVTGNNGGGGENIVRVSGGGVEWPAVASDPVAISSEDPQFGIASLSVGSYDEDGASDTEAGSHPFGLAVNIQLNSELSTSPVADVFPVGETKTFEVQAPAGLVGDPQAVTQCSREQFDGARNEGGSPECPVSSQVGMAIASLGAQNQPTPDYAFLPIYNLVPPKGVPAEFGFSEIGIYGTIDASVRTGGDYGLTETVRDAPQREVMATAVTLWGEPANPRHNVERINESEACGKTRPRTCASALAPLPFLSNPGQCGATMPWKLSVDDWVDPETFVAEPAVTTNDLGLPAIVTGCESQQFEPSVKVVPEETRADSPTGLEVDVHIPQHYNNPEIPAEATDKSIVVKLPTGLEISPSSANGLEACPLLTGTEAAKEAREAQGEEVGVNLESRQHANCPAASKIGTVQAVTPLLGETLHGAVYLAQQNANPFGSLLAVYIVIEGDGVVVKLAGHIEADPQTGQLTTTVADVPDLPFEDAKIDLFSGPRAPVMTPQACGTYRSESVLDPWSGTPSVISDSTFSITSGCTAGFSPAFTAGSTALTAGAYTSVSATISRQDSEQDIGGVSVTLPPGLLGVLKDVKQCAQPQAEAGTCGPESEIGSTTVAAGPGNTPLWLTGRVYLTGPYGGAPFGLSIVVPAIAGPFNLGQVVVRARISINPYTAQVTATTDALPQLVNSSGIPTDVRTVNVTIDRPGFTFNPTNCSPQSVDATVTAIGGQSASPMYPFEVSGCAALPFRPGFAVSTQAKTSKADGASLTVKVSSTHGQANIAKVHVTLPKQLPSRLSTLQKACLASVFVANPAGCPAGADVGTATAITPLLAQPLTGPAYLVSYGSAKFPDLVIVLQGEGVTLDLDGNTDIKNGVTTSTFNAIPDAPISAFTLNLPEGPHSALAGYGNFCKTKLTMPTVLTGQNGARITQTTKITTTGCPKSREAKHGKKARSRKK